MHASHVLPLLLRNPSSGAANTNLPSLMVIVEDPWLVRLVFPYTFFEHSPPAFLLFNIHWLHSLVSITLRGPHDLFQSCWRGGFEGGLQASVPDRPQILSKAKT